MLAGNILKKSKDSKSTENKTETEPKPKTSESVQSESKKPMYDAQDSFEQGKWTPTADN